MAIYMESKITYYYAQFVPAFGFGIIVPSEIRVDISSFTGRWYVKNKRLYIEVEGDLNFLFKNRKVIKFVNSDKINWDEEWPIMSCS